MTDITDMGDQAERCRAIGADGQERRTIEMLVSGRAGPARRKRHHVAEIEGTDRRHAHIGVDVSRQGGEPGLGCVDGLLDGGKTAAIHDALGGTQLFVGAGFVLVGDDKGRGDIAVGDEIGAEFLQRGVGVRHLVVGIGIDEHGLLVGEHLLDDGGDRLALGEPLPAVTANDLLGLGLVEGNEPRGPPIGETEMIEFVEDSRRRRAGIAKDGESAQMRGPQLWGHTAGERGVDEDCVEIGRYFGDGDRLSARRD